MTATAIVLTLFSLASGLYIAFGWAALASALVRSHTIRRDWIAWAALCVLTAGLGFFSLAVPAFIERAYQCQ